MKDDMNAFFSGEKLYGDDFTAAQLKKWYEEEAEGYATLIQDSGTYDYKYNELNKVYGFSRAPLAKNCVALGVGSARCEELIPILPHLRAIVSLDPSEYFSINHLDNVPVTHARPSIDGAMPFADNEFDIITCFGVLHHVANVSFVFSECHRVLKPGGVMFLREPIVSMGDWRKPRPGATKNERGIPFGFLKTMLECHHFEVVSQTFHDFTPLVRLLGKFGVPIFARKWSTVLDHQLSQAFAFHKKYHRVSAIDRFGPASAFLVLRK